MRDAEIEGAAQDCLLAIEWHVVAEVVPHAEADRREYEPGPADAAVGHPPVVASGVGLVVVRDEGHGRDSIGLAS